MYCIKFNMIKKRFKKRLKFKRQHHYLYIILLIILCTNKIIDYIGTRLTPQVEEIVKINISKTLNSYLFNILNFDDIDEDLNDLIILNKNKSDEVVSLDYRFDIVYRNLNQRLQHMFEEVSNLDIKMAYYDYEKEVFFVPLGIIDKGNILITDFGFKLPIKVKFFNDIKLNYKTRVKTYGINSLLVELYLVMDVNSTILSPSTFNNFTNSYEVVLASRVIMGTIPNYYGGTIEKASTIVSS